MMTSITPILRNTLLISTVSFSFLPLNSENSADWVGSYNSHETMNLGTTNVADGEKIYTFQQLQNLRKALLPRYVRIFDTLKYGNSGKLINKGILFTFSSFRSKNIFLAGDFNNWTPVPMRRNALGVYYHILPIRELESGVRYNNNSYVYRYKFLVDGLWTHDPVNPNRVDDGMGAYLSEYRVPGEDTNRQITIQVVKEPYNEDERILKFAIFLPKIKNLSLVGNFNNWNPEHDLLTKDKDGVFRLNKRLKPGNYIYKYIADGKWIRDTYNPETRFFEQLDELCSYVEVN